MSRRLLTAGILVASSWAAMAVNLCHADGQPPVDFTRQIRPILSNKCFLCHGPDEGSREAELRLDTHAAATADRGGYAAIVPGDPAASELMARVTAEDESMAMPPPELKKSLTAEEIELLRRWIAEGAHYTKHWAFIAPVRPEVPQLSQAGEQWARNPIDKFVYAKLEREGLAPSPEADRLTLARRLHFDLLGLPPEVAVADQFAASTDQAAYQQLVETLLASPHYGERWARQWLDAARYADSDGYEKDMQRVMWFYRDWVIRAFNEDKPYNEFIIEQIAGDLLPNATQQQRIATGFLRNSMVNEEGGADPEQFRVEGIFDRMDALGKAILGITTQCAQCHTHKYDPLTHADYYGLFAFFNNSEEASTLAYTDEQKLVRAEVLARVAELEEQLKSEAPDWPARVRAWAVAQRGNQPNWRTLRPTKLPFEGQKFRLYDDGSILSESYAPPTGVNDFEFETKLPKITGVRLEVMMDPQLPAGGPGRSKYGTGAVSEFKLFEQPLEGAGNKQQVKLAGATANVNAAEKPLGAPFYNEKVKGGDKRITGAIALAIDNNAATAWTTDSGPATRHQARNAVFVPKQAIANQGGTRLTVRLNQSHGGWNGNDRQNYLLGRYRISVTDATNPTADPLPAKLRRLIETKDPKTWNEEELGRAFTYWRTTVPGWAEVNQAIATALADYPEGYVQLVAQERRQPRQTFRMERGDFLSPAEEIAPHTPDFLHAFPEEAPRNRLGLAQWLVARDSPTVARAVVNRLWQAYFGLGLVETPEDLGSQSPPPSHPQLLDWLAVELMDSGWSIKHMQRLIANSATYRQASRLTPQVAENDPRNRLLARGPRHRVAAEMVRDAALSASGLLNEEIGGRSVYPPAPRFLFVPPTSYGYKNWYTEQDEQRYRRSLYVHAYRSAQYPPLQVFDAPNGDSACVRRTRSNTPLQALTMLNEPQFMACSRALAERVFQESDSDDARLRRLFRLCVTRKPEKDELAVLQELLKSSRRHFAEAPEEAKDLLQVSPDAVRDGDELSERAAWTVVSRAALNLDETITKQ